MAPGQRLERGPDGLVGTFDVVIVGGGATGITVEAGLRTHARKGRTLSVAIIEPAENHDDQPGGTLVGAGLFTVEQTRRDEASLVPWGVTRIRAAAWWLKTRFLPHLYWSWTLRGSEIDVPHRARSFADAA